MKNQTTFTAAALFILGLACSDRASAQRVAVLEPEGADTIAADTRLRAVAISRELLEQNGAEVIVPRDVERALRAARMEGCFSAACARQVRAVTGADVVLVIRLWPNRLDDNDLKTRQGRRRDSSRGTLREVSVRLSAGGRESYGLSDLRGRSLEEGVLRASREAWERIGLGKTLLLVEAPKHATCFLDGRPVGMTPCRALVSSGKHRLAVEFLGERLVRDLVIEPTPHNQSPERLETFEMSSFWNREPTTALATDHESPGTTKVFRPWAAVALGVAGVVSIGAGAWALGTRDCSEPSSCHRVGWVTFPLVAGVGMVAGACAWITWGGGKVRAGVGAGP